ncbi:MAG: hypothetical protein AB4290_20435 [Spirulina sp.]
MFLKGEQQPPRKIETPDVILIALVFLFNSGLLDRLKNLEIKKGEITANFEQLKQEVNEQKIQIEQEVNEQKEQIKQKVNQLQTQQLESLEKQQKELEELQSYMYSFLLEPKDHEKIEQLALHSEAKTPYQFYASDAVGDELRRLRDWKLIETYSGYIGDIVRASEHGKRSIDLTKYLHVTDLGKKFLLTYEKLKSRDRQETQNHEKIP